MKLTRLTGKAKIEAENLIRRELEKKRHTIGSVKGVVEAARALGVIIPQKALDKRLQNAIRCCRQDAGEGPDDLFSFINKSEESGVRFSDKYLKLFNEFVPALRYPNSLASLKPGSFLLKAVKLKSVRRIYDVILEQATRSSGDPGRNYVLHFYPLLKVFPPSKRQLARIAGLFADFNFRYSESECEMVDYLLGKGINAKLFKGTIEAFLKSHDSIPQAPVRLKIISLYPFSQAVVDEAVKAGAIQFVQNYLKLFPGRNLSVKDLEALSGALVEKGSVEEIQKLEALRKKKLTLPETRTLARRYLVTSDWWNFDCLILAIRRNRIDRQAWVERAIQDLAGGFVSQKNQLAYASELAQKYLRRNLTSKEIKSFSGKL